MNEIATGRYIAINGYTFKVTPYGTIEYINTKLEFIN